MHKRLEQLMLLVDQKRLAGEKTAIDDLDAFWADVARLGTPLLEEADGRVHATFVFREHLDHLVSMDGLTRVWASWGNGSGVELAWLPRTDVWWADVELPENFTGMYAFHCANRAGILVEDVHEPWARTFLDRNARPGSETQHPDEAYGAHVVSTKPHRDVPHGAVTVLDVPAELLPLPERNRQDADATHPETYPVWCYEPPVPRGEGLPVVILLAGQFLEAMDLAETLDRDIAAGTMPPAIVVAPGAFRSGHTAWGWRHAYGPDELSAFFGRAVLPAVRDHLPIDGTVHLVAWHYTTASAIATALRLPAVRSIVLLEPSTGGVGSSEWGRDRRRDGDARARVTDARTWSLSKALGELAEARPRVVIALGRPPQRSGAFAWEYGEGAETRAAVIESGLPLVEFEVSDDNIVAAGEAIGAGVDAAVRAASGHGDDGSPVRRGQREVQ